MEKLTKRGLIVLGGGYFSRLNDNLHLFFKQDLRVTRKLNIGYGIYKNKESIETEYLNIGGMQDS